MTLEFPEIHSLAEATQDIVKKLLAEKLEETSILMEEVQTHNKLMQHAMFSNDTVDTRLAERLTKTTLILLRTIDSETSEYHRRLIQVGARYFTLDDDASGDFNMADGLQDDARVVNAVCRYLGRDDLLV